MAVEHICERVDSTGGFTDFLQDAIEFEYLETGRVHDIAHIIDGSVELLEYRFDLSIHIGGQLRRAAAQAGDRSEHALGLSEQLM